MAAAGGGRLFPCKTSARLYITENEGSPGEKMNGIATSLFDIFKIVPGPSSSHTIGPMRAANDFLRRIALLPSVVRASAGRIEVTLYGSLALTGRGHGTDRAIAAGLLGETPAQCDTTRLEQCLTPGHEAFTVYFPGGSARFGRELLVFDTNEHGFPFSNVMRFRLTDGMGKCLAEELYYSIGGGFIRREGEPPPERPVVPYRYRDWDSFARMCGKYPELTVPRLLRENEIAVSGLSAVEIDSRIDGLIDAMCGSVRRGLSASGVLPGPIRLERRAAKLAERAKTAGGELRSLVLLDAYSMAAAEENAAGHRVVTAPTSGSSGLLPGVTYFLREVRGVSPEQLRDALWYAGVTGFIARSNASISGAEVGCQGEIGVAAAMAAAFLAGVHGCSLATVECAAEIALEHHLGLSCDPVDGYVQIPCIERNAVGAVTAFNSYVIAAMSDPSKRKVRFDEVLAAMLETGRKMSPDFKETSRGGLAACALCC